jgi:hypothetical protein
MANGANESFGGKFWDEFLGIEWLRNRMEAEGVIEGRRVHYDEDISHSSIALLTPKVFEKQEAKKARKAKDEEQNDAKSTSTTRAVINEFLVRRKPAGQDHYIEVRFRAVRRRAQIHTEARGRIGRFLPLL